MGSVEEIREWMSANSDFPTDLDDHMIERFLYVCEFRDDHVKEVMSLFFKYRNEYDEFFTERDPATKDIQQILDVVDFLPLPKLTPEGNQVYVTRLANTSADKFDFISYAKMFFSMTDVRMRVQSKIPAGDIPVFDMAGFSFRHMMKIMGVFSVLKKYMKFTQEVHPVHLVQIHVINTLPVVDKILAFMRPIMREEIRNMIYFHASNSSTLEDYVPKDVLPVEYGGTGESLKDIKARWRELMLEHRDWLMTNPWRGIDKNGINDDEESDEEEQTFKKLSLD